VVLEQPSPEPKVKVMIPMYEPLETSKCKKCGKIIAEPKELLESQKLRGSQAFVNEAHAFCLNFHAYLTIRAVATTFASGSQEVFLAFLGLSKH